MERELRNQGDNDGIDDAGSTGGYEHRIEEFVVAHDLDVAPTLASL